MTSALDGKTAVPFAHMRKIDFRSPLPRCWRGWKPRDVYAAARLADYSSVAYLVSVRWETAERKAGAVSSGHHCLPTLRALEGPGHSGHS